jgi:hypothetical protein
MATLASPTASSTPTVAAQRPAEPVAESQVPLKTDSPTGIGQTATTLSSLSVEAEPTPPPPSPPPSIPTTCFGKVCLKIKYFFLWLFCCDRDFEHVPPPEDVQEEIIREDLDTPSCWSRAWSSCKGFLSWLFCCSKPSKINDNHFPTPQSQQTEKARQE